MHILITEGAGFIGSHLADALACERPADYFLTPFGAFSNIEGDPPRPLHELEHQ